MERGREGEGGSSQVSSGLRAGVSLTYFYSSEGLQVVQDGDGLPVGPVLSYLAREQVVLSRAVGESGRLSRDSAGSEG